MWGKMHLDFVWLFRKFSSHRGIRFFSSLFFLFFFFKNNLFIREQRYNFGFVDA